MNDDVRASTLAGAPPAASRPDPPAPGGQVRNAGAIVLLVAVGCLSATAHQPSRQLQLTRTAMPGLRSTCEVQRTTALVSGTVTIRPGETLCIQVQTRGDSITPVALLAEVAPGVLVLTLRQDGGNQTTLTFQNPLSVVLRYRAAIRLPGKSDSQYTGTCPVLAQRFAVESWPYPVQELILSDFKVETQSDAVTCN